jgi:hypothetical protein
MSGNHTQLQKYWNRRRRTFIRHALFWIVGVIGALIALGLGRSEVRRLSSDPLSAFSGTQIQDVAIVINVFMGIVLTVATCYYAWITQKTLGELTETRRVARRPTLLLKIGKPQLIHHEVVNRFETVIEVINTGLAVAIRPVAQITAPSRAPDEPGKSWSDPVLSICTTLREIPALLLPGTSGQYKVSLPVEIEQLPTGNFSFLQAVLVYEDMDLNQFTLTQEYDLWSDGFTPSSLILRYERLTMVACESRVWVRDSDRQSAHIDPLIDHVIYERVDFLFERQFEPLAAILPSASPQKGRRKSQDQKIETSVEPVPPDSKKERKPGIHTKSDARQIRNRR